MYQKFALCRSVMSWMAFEKTLPSVPRLGRSVATVDLSFLSIPDVGCPLLVVCTIGKTDRTKASCHIEAPCTLIRLEG